MAHKSGEWTLRVGLDIIRVSRIEKAIRRWNTRFLDRVFSTGEQEDCRGRSASLAARFAAKEAVLKALGTGLAQGIRWTDVEIRTRANGEPRVILHGNAVTLARSLGIHAWEVSLTHDGEIAAAIVVGYGWKPRG
ncbi:MAG: holo-ACP synthase [Chloroflexi bacterium]|nr:holo-ACP synthase [Chloroflexota bacterium]